MAQEVTFSNRISWSKNGAQIICSASQRYDQTGEQAFQSVQIIGASSEAISIGDVTTPGWVGFKNMNADGGAIVHVSLTNPATEGNAFASLEPGDGIITPSSQTAWFAISASGNSNLLVTAIEA